MDGSLGLYSAGRKPEILKVRKAGSACSLNEGNMLSESMMVLVARIVPAPLSIVQAGAGLQSCRGDRTPF
jgi:hypothetical protein